MHSPTKFIQIVVVYATIIILQGACTKKEEEGNRLNSLPNKVEAVLDEIKRVEYLNVGLLREQVDILNLFSNEEVKIYAKYYSLKADFLEGSTFRSQHAFDSIYDELKAQNLYNLMAEVDILSTYFYYAVSDYSLATTYVERSLEYCFKDGMFLERQALIYGLSAEAIINTPQEKNMELLQTKLELEPYEWSFYHSQIFNNLAWNYLKLEEYKAAEEVLSEAIAENKKLNFNLELAKNYRFLGVVREKATDNPEIFIDMWKKSIELRKRYGSKFLALEYGAIGHRYFSTGRYEKAYDSYAKAIENANGDIGTLGLYNAYLGWAYFKMDERNNYDKANEYYQKAISYGSENPGNSEAREGHRMALERKIWSLRELRRDSEADKLESELLQAENLNYREKVTGQLDEFRSNTMAGLRSKNNRIAHLKNINHLQEEKLKRRQMFAIAVSLIALLALILLLLLYRDRKNVVEIKRLNKELKVILSKVEGVNASLKLKNQEITRLLGINEKILFSKILQISAYKDTINRLVGHLSDLTMSNEHVKSAKLFPVEKTLRTLIDEKEIWEDFKIQFEKTRPGFFRKLRKLVPDLSVNELKHCTYIVSKLRAKEVSNLINVSPRSVETARYRIKKKLGLGKGESLFHFLQGLNMDVEKGAA